MESIKRRSDLSKMMEGFAGIDPMEDFQVSKGLNRPAVNISENKLRYKIEIGAPGLCKEDYNLSIDNDIIKIKATKEADREEKEDTYTRKEFGYTGFERSFTLPDAADTDEISASCKDGVLQIIVPKKDEVRGQGPKKVKIV